MALFDPLIRSYLAAGALVRGLRRTGLGTEASVLTSVLT